MTEKSEVVRKNLYPRISPLAGVMSFSGGLIYHWRAFWWGQLKWKSFRSEITNWLSAEFKTQSDTLVVVGSSGGYTIDSKWLTQFKTVVAIDPDPIGLFIFGLKHKNVEKLRAWATPNLLQALKLSHKGACFLFSNVLGQIAVDPKATHRLELMEGLREVLCDCDWASYHDRLSGAHAPEMPYADATTTDARSRDRVLSNDEILSRFYAGAAGGELIDHSLGELVNLDNLSATYFCWPLRPGAYHLIEAVAHACLEKSGVNP